MFVLTFMCNSCTPHGDFGEPTHEHAQTYTSGGILTQWRGPSAPLCFCWRWWSPTVSIWQRPQQKPNQLQNDGGAEQGITWISHSLTPSHSYALSLSVWLSKTFRPGSYFFSVSDTGRRSRAHAPSHWPGLSWAVTCPLSWWKLPGCSKQTCVLTSRNVVWGNNIKVDFNMTLERLNPTELFAGPSLQSYVVQKRIVQTHRTLF